MTSNSGGLIGILISFGVASAAGFFALAALMVLGDWTLLQALFAAALIFFVLGSVLAVVFGRPLPGPVAPGSAGVDAPTSAVTAKDAPSSATVKAPTPAAPATSPAPASPARAPAEATAPATDGDGTKPATLGAAREGGADDLKKIKGVGPKLEQTLHGMGYYHFDQIAAWTAAEVAWVDENLEGFKGRVSRDNWVEQAKHLAAGEDTEFSRKVDKGDVY